MPLLEDVADEIPQRDDTEAYDEDFEIQGQDTPLVSSLQSSGNSNSVHAFPSLSFPRSVGGMEKNP
jgi:hypothetical protein